MRETIHRQYVPVEKMYVGDRFLTHRSGWVVAVSEPYPNPDGGVGSYCIKVRRESDKGMFELIGVNRYNVETVVVS